MRDLAIVKVAIPWGLTTPHVCVQEGIALKRVMPWLWPLADTASAAAAVASTFPASVHQLLVAALAAYPLPATEHQAGEAGVAASHTSSGGGRGQELSEKRDLLVSSLRAVWS